MSFMFPCESLAPQRRLEDEIIIDDFCGGGGASEAIFQALGRHPDEAANHDAPAIAMHMQNHPTTNHWNQNIWQVDPFAMSKGRPIGLAWFSPDCKHFSLAAAGKPRDRNIRNLAWVVHLYARMPNHLRPRIIFLENVEAFVTWGDLLPNGKPDPKKKGETFKLWVAELRRLGYEVEWRELRASDFGAPTRRKRLYLVARCDGVKIVWPEPTHGDPANDNVRNGTLKPYRTIADQLDWSLDCPSLFLSDEDARRYGVRRPLAENTLHRIGKGFRRFALEAEEPFLVTCNHQGDGFRGQGVHEPFKTVTAARDAHGLVVPYIARIGQTGQSDDKAYPVGAPLTTVTAKAEHMLVAPFLSRFHGRSIGSPANAPSPTSESRNTDSVVAAYLTSFYSHCTNGGDGSLNRPMGTVTAEGFHHGIVAADLATSGMSEEERYGAWWVARFSEKYAGMESTSVIPGPRPSFVTIKGIPVVDLGMRMLTPREQFNAQGFRPDYIIDFEYKGKPLSKEAQQRMCGNSVSPPPAIALIRANCRDLAVPERRAA